MVERYTERLRVEREVMMQKRSNLAVDERVLRVSLWCGKSDRYDVGNYSLYAPKQ